MALPAWKASGWWMIHNDLPCCQGVKAPPHVNGFGSKYPMSYHYFHNSNLKLPKLGLCVDVLVRLTWLVKMGSHDYFNTAVVFEYSALVFQVILKWVLQRGIVVIPKSVNKERIESNMALFDFSLTDDQMKALSSLDKGFRCCKL